MPPFLGNASALVNQPIDRPGNVSCYRILVPLCIDHNATFRFSLGDCKKSLSAAAVDGKTFLLKAVGNLLSAALIGPAKPLLRCDIQYQCHVGIQPVQRCTFQRRHELRIKISGNALINPGRIHEPVAKYGFSVFNCRPNYLLDVI